MKPSDGKEIAAFFLKLIDSAALKLHHPAVIGPASRPEPATEGQRDHVDLDDRQALQQIIVLDRFLLHAKHASLRRYAVQHKGYALNGWLKNWAKPAIGSAPQATPGRRWAWHQASNGWALPLRLGAAAVPASRPLGDSAAGPVHQPDMLISQLCDSFAHGGA